jgi:hypothetical protein
MLGAEHLLADRQRAVEERPRPRKVVLVPKQDGEVVEALRRFGMLGAEPLLADRQRALVERPRPRKVALGPKQASEVIEALRRRPRAFSKIASVRW